MQNGFFEGPNEAWLNVVLSRLGAVLIEMNNDPKWQGFALARSTTHSTIITTVGLLSVDERGLQSPRVCSNACEKACRARLTGKRTMLTKNHDLRQFGGGVSINTSGYGMSAFKEDIDEAGALIVGTLSEFCRQRPDAEMFETFRFAESTILKLMDTEMYSTLPNPQIMEAFLNLKSAM
jgi:hypothetical protein